MTRELTLTIDKVCMDSKYIAGEGTVKKPMSHASTLMEDRLYCALELPGELPLGTEVRVRIEVGPKEQADVIVGPHGLWIDHIDERSNRVDRQIAGIDEAVGKALQGIEERSK